MMASHKDCDHAPTSGARHACRMQDDEYRKQIRERQRERQTTPEYRAWRREYYKNSHEVAR